MARCELIVRQDGAIWLGIIFKPLLTAKRTMEDQTNPKESPNLNLIFQKVNFVAGCSEVR